LDVTMMLRASSDWVEAIDRWRERQPDQLPRSVAIRDLVERGLASAGVPVRRGLPYQQHSIDAREATMVQVGRVNLTVFDDGEVRIITKRRGK
jgi:uroporphyrinogen-III synthase